MNEIIKNIEAAQLKAEVPEFHVGDTVRVLSLIHIQMCIRDSSGWNDRTKCPGTGKTV